MANKEMEYSNDINYAEGCIEIYGDNEEQFLVTAMQEALDMDMGIMCITDEGAYRRVIVAGPMDKEQYDIIRRKADTMGWT